MKAIVGACFNMDVGRLTRTPILMPGELQRGYLLRLAEQNGYDSLTTLLSLAGVEGNAARATLVPIAPFAPLMRKNIAELQLLKSAFTNDCPVPSALYLDIKAAKLCPACVNELGYLQQFWGLAYAVACPIHQGCALTHCPSCSRKLSWARPGLTTCRCGHEFSLELGSKITCSATLALLHLLCAKCQQLPVDEARMQDEGFPFEVLGALSLSDLMALIGKLAGQLRRETLSRSQEVQIAALALAQWPKGFHRYLDAVALQKEKAPHTLGLQAQHTQLYSALFKSKLPATVKELLKRELCAWGGSSSARLHPRHRIQIRTTPKYIGVTEAAKRISVQPVTVKQLIKLGILSAHLAPNGRTWLVDTSRGLPKKDTGGDSLCGREAAAWLGLPQSVLEGLRREGCYLTTRLPARSSSFSQYDLIVFRERLMAAASENPSGKLRSMAEVMRGKYGTPAIKIAIVEAVLSGLLTAYRVEGGGIPELQLDASGVSAIIAMQRVNLPWLVPHQAAQAIGCDPLVIDALVEEGFLKARITNRRREIEQASVAAFRERYLPLAVLARKAGTSSQKLQGYCNDHQIPLLEVARRGGKGTQSLIAVSNVMLLEPQIGAPLLIPWLECEVA